MPPSSIHMDHVRATHRMMREERASATPASLSTNGTVSQAGDADGKAEGEGGMSFWDVLDVVNPLQHIPVVNKIYQAITGDTIKTPAKVAGSALFFGPIGMAIAAVDAVVEHETGKDIADNVVSLFTGNGEGKNVIPPAEDDPFTVTAPRPRHAQAAPLPDGAPSSTGHKSAVENREVPELSTGQAALLESLMQQGGAMPAPGVVPAAAGPASAAALGGIGNAQQLKSWQAVPGASAAKMVAAGLGAGASVASLPTPGEGGGSDMVAALAQDQASTGHRNPGSGRTLADYRSNAIVRGSMAPKPLLPNAAVQMVQQQAEAMPTVARVPTGVASPTPETGAVSLTPAVQSDTTLSHDAPPQPVAQDKFAEMMMMGLGKYQAQQRRNDKAASPDNSKSSILSGAF